MKIVRSHIQPRVVNRESKVEGILSYDFDNAYPQRYTDIVNASGTGKYCTKLYGKFIEGDGFKDKTFYKSVIDSKGTTLDKLLRSVAKDFANRNGFAIHVNWNALHKIVDMRFIPFHDCRLALPDGDHANQIAVYDDWGRRKQSRILKDRIQYYDKFNPDPAMIEVQVQAAGGWANWKGQIYWYSTEGKDYPLAPLDAVIEDAESEGRIKNHKRKKSASGFNADTVFIHKGKFEDDTERKNFKKSLEDFQGDEASDIMLIEVETDDQIPEIKKFEKSTGDKDFYTTNETSVQYNIRKELGIPGILAAENVQGALGLSTQMRDAYAVYNGLTNQERRTFEEAFQMLFSYWFNPGINPSNDYSIIPVSYQTGDEKAPLAVQFGVGGTQAVQNILIDTTLQPAQKINTLIILFGLTSEQATAMVTGTAIPPEDQPE